MEGGRIPSSEPCIYPLHHQHGVREAKEQEEKKKSHTQRTAQTTVNMLLALLHQEGRC